MACIRNVSNNGREDIIYTRQLKLVRRPFHLKEDWIDLQSMLDSMTLLNTIYHNLIWCVVDGVWMSVSWALWHSHRLACKFTCLINRNRADDLQFQKQHTISSACAVLCFTEDTCLVPLVSKVE